ncbi:MAG: OsmC family protein [Bryobacteraceae bacterium]|jgi:putative redox protein
MAAGAPEVVVRGSVAGFAQEITAGPHRFFSDEPKDAGGENAGPSPYELLAAALGACTSMTLGMYARSKQWPLASVIVRLRHSKIHANDCVDCDTKDAALDRIERDIELTGDLTGDQRAKLLEIADKCPVHRTLTRGIKIHTRLV